MASKLLWDVCKICFSKDSPMGEIICAADNVKLRERIFRVTRFRVPAIAATLHPVCERCRSKIVRYDAASHGPQFVSTTGSMYPTVLLNVDQNDPLAVAESPPKLHRSNYVPAEERRTDFVSNPMGIFKHMCELCGTVVQSIENHLAQHQVGDMFRCIFCDLFFVNKGLLEGHISGHNKKLFVCHLCGQAFRSMALLKSHMIKCCRNSSNNVKRHSKVYDCTFCAKKFSSDYKRLKHQDQHNIRRSYECLVCRDVFPSMEYLRSHRRNHAINRGMMKPVEVSNIEYARIDSYVVNDNDLMDTERKDISSEMEQQVMEPGVLLPTSEALAVTKATSDNIACMEENPPAEIPLNTMESDLVARTNVPNGSRENKCFSESSTITDKHKIPCFIDIPHTPQPRKSITILDVINLPRLQSLNVNRPTESPPSEPPTKSEELDDPPNPNVCEDSICQLKLIKLEILPAWKSHDKINPELWPILGVPSSLPDALQRRTISASKAKEKENRKVKQGFEDRLVQLPPCLKKDCNCDDLIRCLYMQ